MSTQHRVIGIMGSKYTRLLGWMCRQDRHAARRRESCPQGGVGLEILERRMLVTAVNSGTPVPIPIGNVKAGQVIQLNVNLATTDPDDQSEGEPLILVPSAGNPITISNYGSQVIALPIIQDGETLTGYVFNYDDDETANVSVAPSAQIQINDTAAKADNITLYNPTPLALAFTQTINAKVTNTSPEGETFQLSMSKVGTGNATLSASSVTLAAGASTEVTITPTADSSALQDVHIIVSSDGLQVSEDDLTVVGVIFPSLIYNQDSPAQMVSAGKYRIPPRTNTPVNVTLTLPNLGASGQFVTLTALGQSAATGTLNIDGNPTENLATSTNVNLSGLTQTMPSSPLTFDANNEVSNVAAIAAGNANAGQLKLALQVRGQNTIQSNGFSVSAIPLNYTESYVRPITGASRGLVVQDGWSSDSGNVADLDQSALSEVVQSAGGTGLFAGSGSSQNSNYLIGTSFTTDSHSTPVTQLTGLKAASGLKSGKKIATQVNVFLDARTGIVDIPMQNSGFTITRTVYTLGNTMYLTTSKVGAATTAKGVSSGAGTMLTTALVTQTVATLAPGDPLVITTAPPASVGAGVHFTVVVTAENGDGSTNTSFTDSISVFSDDGNTLGGVTTVNAVKGVATFTLWEDQAGDDSLDFFTNTLPDVFSDTFTVTPGPATQLVIEPVSSSVAAGATFSVAVDAEDTFGNINNSYSGNVTMALLNNPGSSTLGGTLTVAAFGGQAFFSDLTLSNEGTGYTLRATASGLTAGVSNAFDVTDQLVITVQPPTTVQVGAPFGLTVTAEDGQGNVDPAFTGDVTVFSEFGQNIGGTLTVTAVNGVATFTNLTETLAGSEELGVSSGDLPTGTTDSFTLTPQAATQLDIQGPNGTSPGNVISSPFSLDVDAEDQFGNEDPTYNGMVTLSFANNPTGAVLGGTLTVQAVNGEASFTGLTINNLGNGYTLQATASGLGSNVSIPFDVLDQVGVVTQPPDSITAGTPFGLVVAAEIGFGTIDTAYTGDITLTLSNFSGGNGLFTLNGTLTEPAVNGVATFAGLTEDQAGSFGLVITGTGLSPTTTLFNIQAGAATQLVITAQPPAATVGAAFEVDVSAEDSFGNVDTTYSAGVSLALVNNPGNATLANNGLINAVNGVAAFTSLTLNHVGIGYTIQAISSGLTPATTGPVNVTAVGVANELQITDETDFLTAGSVFSLTVAATDTFGNVDNNFSGLVTIALGNNPGGATLGGVLALHAVNGVVTFSNLTMDIASDGYTIVATAAGLAPATTFGIEVDPAAGTKLVVSGPTTNVLTNSPFNLTISIEDPLGNVDTNFFGDVTLVLGNHPLGATLGGTLTVSAEGGIASFTDLTLSTVGNGYTIQANSSGLTSGVSVHFNVTNDQLVIETQPPSSAFTNTGFGLVVVAQNGSGVTDTGFHGNVTVAMINFGVNTPVFGGTLTVAAVNGVATFAGLTIDQPGDYALSITSAGLPETSTDTFNITTPTTQLVVETAPPALVTATAPFEIDVAATDAEGNVATNFNGSITLAMGNNPGPSILGGILTLNAVNGLARFSGLTLTNTGVGYTIVATSGGLTQAVTNAFNVTPVGVATQLVVTTAPPGSVTAGAGFGLIVAAEDSAGTIATSFHSGVTLHLTNYSANPAATLGGMVTVLASNGVATFSGLLLDNAGDYSLSATGGSLPAVATGVFSVAAAAANHLAVVGPTGNVLTGGLFPLTVDAEDSFGNVNLTYSGNVMVALSANPAGGSLGGGVIVAASHGVARYTNLTLSLPGTGYSLQANAAGLSSGVSSLFNVYNDALKVTTLPPASVAAGNNFGFTVSAMNGAGHVNTTFNGNVTIDWANNAALNGFDGGVLGGTLTVKAVNGVAAFTGLNLTPPGAYLLPLISPGAAPAVTSLVSVTTGPTQLQVTTEPVSAATAGSPFEVDVTAEDGSGDPVTSFNGSVTLSILNNPASGTLGGTLTVNAVNGVAAFPGLSINHAGAGYTLQATSNGLTAATTTAIDVTLVGVANHLVVTTQPPSSVTAGSSFGLVVTAEDSFGAVDTNFSGSVTVGDGSGDLVGTSAVGAVNGVATFTGLSLNQAGDYIISASGAGLTAGQSQVFSVVAAPATQLAIVGPNANVLTGQPFGLDVMAVDNFGNLDTTFTGSVTLSLTVNPGGSTLGGTVTLAAVNGVASFSGLTINHGGTGYTLQAASNSLLGSVTFDVTADQLAVTTQPPTQVATGGPIAVVVSAQNSSGALDATFNGSVTAALVSLGENSATLGGTMTVAAVNGVATFTNLTIGATGSYELFFSGSGVGGTPTNAIDVTSAPPVTLGPLTLSPDPVAQHQKFTLTAADPQDADGTITGVKFYLDANGDGIPQAGELLGEATTAATNGDYSLTLPVNWAAGPQTYLAQAVDNLGQTSLVSSDAGTVLPSVLVHLDGVTLKSVVFTDANGTTGGVSAKLDTIDAIFVGQNLGQHTSKGVVTITGTDVHLLEVDVTSGAAPAAVTFTAKGGTKFYPVSIIDVTGSASAINGAGVDVGNLMVTGTAGKITLHNLTGGQVSIGGSAASPGSTWKVGTVTGETIVSAMPVASMTVAGFATSSLTGPVVEKFTTKGSFNGSFNLMGQDLMGLSLGTFSVTGTLNSSQIITAGSVKAMTLGAINASQLLIGTSNGVTGLAGSAGNFASHSSLGSLTVKGLAGSTGASFTASVVDAWVITKASLKLVDTVTGGAGPFGFAADNIGSIAFLAASVNSGKTVTLKGLTSPADLTNPKNNPTGVLFPVGNFTLSMV